MQSLKSSAVIGFMLFMVFVWVKFNPRSTCGLVSVCVFMISIGERYLVRFTKLY